VVFVAHPSTFRPPLTPALHIPPTAGGTVVSASSLGTINGVRIALEGDQVACPACKSTGRIFCEGERLPETWNGKRVALENDLCVCKCSPLPRLIPAQTVRYQIVDRDGSMSTDSAQDSAVAAVDGFASGASPQKPAFNERFTLVDEASSKVLSDVEYAIVRANGAIEHGRTDASGHTHLLTSTAVSEKVEIHVDDSCGEST
jgi:uncharacterized Zn-binding protein involved in type VI secretion